MGVDDAVSMPVLADHADEYSLSFWINVNSLPAAGQQQLIFDTHSEEDGAMDLYIDDSGKLVLEIAGFVSDSYDGGAVKDSNWTGPHSSQFSFASNLNSWQHIAYTFDDTVGQVSNTKLWVNGSEDSRLSGTLIPNLLLGPGTIGNTAAGDSPLNGALDELSFYNLEMIDDEILDVRDGTYFEPDDNHFRTPTFLLQFEEEPDYDATVFYDSAINLNNDQPYNNHLTCSGTACPAITPNGQIGEAIVFDGVDDVVELPRVVSNQLELQVDVWVNVTKLPANGEIAYLFDSADIAPNEEYPQIYIDDSGHIVMDFESGSSGGGSKTSSFSFAGSLDQWTKLSFNFKRLSSNNTLDYLLKINGVDDSSTSTFSDVHNIRFGGGQMGNNAAGNAPFTGMVDGLVIWFKPSSSDLQEIYHINFTPSVMPQIELTNRATAAGAAVCEFAFNCPTIDPSGQFGEALLFDGNDDYLSVNPVDFAQGDYTIGLWFKTASAAQQMLFAATPVSTGDHGITLQIENGRLDYLHRLPGGSSGGQTLTSSSGLADGEWHYLTVTRQGTMLSLYVNGVLVDSDTTTRDGAELLDISLGRFGPDQNSQMFNGSLDEVIVIPAAVEADGVNALMNSTFPAISISSLFETFSANAGESVSVAGSAKVNTNATHGRYVFAEEVEAALELQSAIDYPFIDANADKLVVFFPFEDVPGSTIFEDIVNVEEGSCSENSCPTAGLRGQVGRAVYFDGIDDEIFTEGAGAGNGTTISTWVKADRGTIFDSRDLRNSGDLFEGVQLDMENLKIVIDTASSSIVDQEITNIPLNIPKNVWSHVVITYDNDEDDGNGEVKVYINGELSISYTTVCHLNSNNDCGLSGEMTLGRNKFGVNPLHGYLDNFRLYSNLVLSAAKVQALYAESVPLMQFEFDEEGDATSFLDSAIYGYVGLPTRETAFDDVLQQEVTKISPIPGTNGQIGNTALFDGSGYIEVQDAAAVNNLVGGLTTLAWVKPDGLTGDQIILSSRSDGDTNGFSVGIRNDRLWYVTNGTLEFVSDPILEEDVWQHVAVTADTGFGPDFYVDGVLVTSKASFPLGMTANTNHPLYIGGQHSTSGTPNKLFTGQIDELSVHGRELTAGELYSIYLRELRWYRDRYVTTLEIDSDSPTIELLTTHPYRQSGYIQLAVSAVDLSSNVILVDMGLKGPSDGTFAWADVPVCSEALSSGNAWCPSFEATAEGEYQLQFRAVDSVGNETISGIYSFYIDDTAPTTTSSYSGNWVAVAEDGDALLTWTIPLSGSLSDPDIAPALTGSGINDEQIFVKLTDKAGGILNGTAQIAAATNGDWNLDYATVGQRPLGTYTVTVTAEDMLGNSATLDVGAIRLDARPPTVEIDAQTLTSDVLISTTLPISGTISDLPEESVYGFVFNDDEVVGAEQVDVGLRAFDFASASSGSTIAWEAASLSSPNAPVSNWIYELPEDIQGFYELVLRGEDGFNNQSRESIVWRGTIDNVPPTIVGSGLRIGNTHAQQTEYTLTFSDFILDEDSLIHPCGAGDLISQAYSDPDQPHNGRPYEITVTCRVNGHDPNFEVTVCDVAGHCTEEKIVPTASNQGNILIDSPADGFTAIEKNTITISGGAYDPTSITSLRLYDNGIEIAQPTVTGNDSSWSTDWSTNVIDSYQIEAVLVGSAGTVTDTINISVAQDPLDDLYVRAGGNGSGTITSNPAGINCGSDCHERYPYTSLVTLTATADFGATFSGWDGACSGGGACTVTMNDTAHVTATYTLNKYNLNASTAGNGSGVITSHPADLIDCATGTMGDCSEDLEFGTTITLTAAADFGSTFSGWSGGCSGTGPCTVTV
ncbi:MAG: LamG-like jellyroll fold domain-containing protein, partial [Chloroflexota bacterium]